MYILNVSTGELGNKENFLVKYSRVEPELYSKIEFYGIVTGTEIKEALLTGAILYFVIVDGLLISFPE